MRGHITFLRIVAGGILLGVELFSTGCDVDCAPSGAPTSPYVTLSPNTLNLGHGESGTSQAHAYHVDGTDLVSNWSLNPPWNEGVLASVGIYPQDASPTSTVTVTAADDLSSSPMYHNGSAHTLIEAVASWEEGGKLLFARGLLSVTAFNTALWEVSRSVRTTHQQGALSHIMGDVSFALLYDPTPLEYTYEVAGSLTTTEWYGGGAKQAYVHVQGEFGEPTLSYKVNDDGRGLTVTFDGDFSGVEPSGAFPGTTLQATLLVAVSARRSDGAKVEGGALFHRAYTCIGCE